MVAYEEILMRAGYSAVMTKDELGTREVLSEIRELLGQDEFGRQVPAYAVLHRALVELRDRLKAQKGESNDNGDTAS